MRVTIGTVSGIRELGVPQEANVPLSREEARAVADAVAAAPGDPGTSELVVSAGGCSGWVASGIDPDRFAEAVESLEPAFATRLTRLASWARTTRRSVVIEDGWEFGTTPTAGIEDGGDEASPDA